MKQEKKPEFEPWNKKELSIMNLSLGQEQQKRLKSLSEIRKIELGLDGIDKEIETNLGNAELKLKVARMELADLEFDKKHKITIQRLELRVMELKDETDRCDINIRNFKFQIKEGKPKVIEMPEEPEIIKSDEEKAKEKEVPVDEAPVKEQDTTEPKLKPGEKAEKEAVEDTAADSRNDDQPEAEVGGEESAKEEEA